MTLKQQISSDLSVFFNTDDFADSAVYNSHDGTYSSKSIKIIIDYNADLSKTEFGAADTTQIILQKSEIVDPKIYDTIVFDGVTYTIRQRLSGDNYTWNVAVESDQCQNPRGV